MNKKILGLVAALLISSSAFADSCAVALMPTFTAAQAKRLCATFTGNTTVGATLLPGADNAYDLGSAAKQFRTGYFGTNVILSGGLLTVGANVETVAGAGTTVADAGALSGTKFIHQVTGANGTVGVKLAAVGANAGQVHVILNTTAGVLKVYAESGGTVNGGSADAAFSALTGIKPIICYSVGAKTWICA